MDDRVKLVLLLVLLIIVGITLYNQGPPGPPPVEE